MKLSPELEKIRDELAEKYQADDFKHNPDGYTVSTYCNEDTTVTAFAAGFNAAAEILLKQESAEKKRADDNFEVLVKAMEEVTNLQTNLDLAQSTIKKLCEACWDGYQEMSALINGAEFSNGPAVRDHLEFGHNEGYKTLAKLKGEVHLW